jgi:hypothetical protein
MDSNKETIVIWAIVDSSGELIDAKTTRVGAYKRVEFLDQWANYNEEQGRGLVANSHNRKVLAPFQVIRCVGTFILSGV